MILLGYIDPSINVANSHESVNVKSESSAPYTPNKKRQVSPHFLSKSPVINAVSAPNESADFKSKFFKLGKA